MKVTVQLSEPFWRLVEAKEVTLELSEGDTVADMISTLEEQYPALQAYLSQADLPATVFLDDELAGPETQLTKDARPVVVWPLAGG